MDKEPQFPQTRRPGRAASTNATNRYERFQKTAVDDGWEMEEDLPPLRTELSFEKTGRALSRNRSPDVPFDRSVNPYRGCEHGCIYCFARPTHAWLGLSPGLDFETRLIARPGLAEKLRREFSAKSYQPAVLAIGTNTDAYQPVERGQRIMPKILSVLQEFRHPVSITTKGVLIERDSGLLAELAAERLCNVSVSVTTLDRDLARRLEPRVPAPARRLKVIEKLARLGIAVNISASPMIPGLSDHELEAILAAGSEAGAISASMIPLRLPLEVAPLFREWLAENYPGRASRVMGRVRQFHGGQDYDPAWGTRMTGQGVHAQLLQHRFSLACKFNGLRHNLPRLDLSKFRVPPEETAQLSLF